MGPPISLVDLHAVDSQSEGKISVLKHCNKAFPSSMANLNGPARVGDRSVGAQGLPEAGQLLSPGGLNSIYTHFSLSRPMPGGALISQAGSWFSV